MSIQNLRNLLNGATPVTMPVAPPVAQPPRRNDLPASSEITVTNGYWWDNGPNVKPKERYKFTLQFFTNTTPFVPTVEEAAWNGFVRLLAPIGFLGWLQQHREDFPNRISDELYHHYYNIIGPACDLPTHGEFPLMGQLRASTSGTHFEYGSFILVNVDEDGEIYANIHFPDGGIIKLRDFRPNTKPKSFTAWSDDDYHRLKQAKPRPQRRAKP